MYRVNPFTYIIEGLLGTGLGSAPMTCADTEYIRFIAPENSTCGEYLSSYISQAGGNLENPSATECQYCPVTDTNQFLTSINVSFGHRWRNFGILLVFSAFNIGVALGVYWLARVPTPKKNKKA